MYFSTLGSQRLVGLGRQNLLPGPSKALGFLRGQALALDLPLISNLLFPVVVVHGPEQEVGHVLSGENVVNTIQGVIEGILQRLGGFCKAVLQGMGLL